MYVKYVTTITSGTEKDYINAFLADIKGLVDGTITSTAQFNSNVCNTGASTIIGSMPSEYSDAVIDTNAGTSDPSLVSFTKSHGDTTRDWKKKLSFAWTPDTYRMRWRMENKSNDAIAEFTDATKLRWPVDAFHNGYAIADAFGSTDYTDHAEFHFIFGKEAFVFQSLSNNYSTFYNFGVYDREPFAMDTYITDTYDSDYGPFVGFTTIGNNNHITNSNSGKTSNWLRIGNKGYLKGDNTGYNINNTFDYETEQFTPYHTWNYGYASAAQCAMQLLPQPGLSINYFQSNAIEPDHVLMPVYSTGGSFYNATAASQSHGQWGRLPALFRTTNDLGPTGTQVTVNGVDYTIFKSHKTGAEYIDTNCIYNSCYLVPTTLGDV